MVDVLDAFHPLVAGWFRGRKKELRRTKAPKDWLAERKPAAR